MHYDAAAMSRWQPKGEALQFMQMLWALAHALDVRSKRMARTLGVTGPQRLVLRIIGQTPDATAGAIAKLLDLHASTLTGVLARLERRKLIVRRVDPADRRRVRFSLTAAGRRIDRARKGTVEHAVQRTLARSTAPSVAASRALITRLVEELLLPQT
jgi:DNA-binding MarR family transcriptional regulator